MHNNYLCCCCLLISINDQANALAVSIDPITSASLTSLWNYTFHFLYCFLMGSPSTLKMTLLPKDMNLELFSTVGRIALESHLHGLTLPISTVITVAGHS